MASHDAPTNSGLSRFWPFGAGGLFGPVLATLLTRWMRFDAALGIGMFIAFTAAMLVFERRSRRVPETLGRSLTVSLVSGVVAGLVGGGMASLLHWQ
jgi:hypothetical protein